MDKNKVWVGWIITIVLSVGGSWASMNARVYNTESEIEVQ